MTHDKKANISSGSQLGGPDSPGFMRGHASCGTLGNERARSGTGDPRTTSRPGAGVWKLCGHLLSPWVQGLAFITQSTTPTHKGPGPASTSRPPETFRPGPEMGPDNGKVSKQWGSISWVQAPQPTGTQKVEPVCKDPGTGLVRSSESAADGGGFLGEVPPARIKELSCYNEEPQNLFSALLSDK